MDHKFSLAFVLSITIRLVCYLGQTFFLVLSLHLDCLFVLEGGHSLVLLSGSEGRHLQLADV